MVVSGFAPGIKSKTPAPCTPNVPDVPTPMLGGLQPDAQMMGPGRTLIRRAPPGFQTVGPIQLSYGGRKPGLHTACSSRAFIWMGHGRTLRRRAPARLTYVGHDRALTVQAQPGFQTAGPFQAFIRHISARPSYGGPQPDFQPYSCPDPGLTFSGAGGPRPGF